MKNLVGVVLVGALCALCVVGCKKKEAAAPAAGSAAMGSDTGSATGSAVEGSAAMGSDTGSAAMGSATGSAMEGSAAGSATGSAMEGSAAGSGEAAAAHWNCKKLCKLAVGCKSPAFKSAKECDTDCTKLENDTDGRYARGSIEGTPYYTCVDKAKDCAAVKKCDHP